ncbi:DeoR/GlpR family DNA-binding transcription regulator [Jiella sonneratiae]|uniref:DeoR/GlpR transcriptional regulator n=1 Tax=Jiella sonneratiae TaxID=2816856 RepID=A0ABS3IYG7_9HYPH|nr:DeoR/GlpR family DNA-binding transcription regulator [Jiella sonneratiae]MBO0902448.1 DeoR/GlpR transcriptional regulator [Jiella sonneratiae]
MVESERQERICDVLRERSFATVRDLQAMFGVSPATIRRDIDKLNETGAARKVHGGVSAVETVSQRLAARSYDENRDVAVEAKRAIARAAEALVEDGDSIIVNAGSTCFEFGIRLAQRSLGVYTNSMPLAAALGRNAVCQLVVAGGTLYREPGILHDVNAGPPAFFASKYFLGAHGLGPGGVLESHPLLVKAIGELASRADEIVILADSRKFALRPRFAVLPLERVGTLVTDDGLSDRNARMLEDEGVAIVVAATARAAGR